ncbi:DUF4097 family beta strand repeat-containing protein [Kitasatospora sp. GP82]|uniref:DUF4097 family beta strand repeat-containing protein n=1 Tax=Kitasatospora sp. GP82 TaxID=3035089 RepID=UPI0024766E0F|nr:DUF4097 family beta strand repeat-containing protein [Kitasatospora sp. GP82]MDH6125473.1 DUF4097 and DUF4098 domain-containing protein YvlB [Kitasatospora sp. GP82]
MPSFDTPEPISVTLEFDIGSARITASGRTDTVVEVLPSNGADDADVRAAQQTKVTCSGGKLLVKGPRKRSLFGKSGSLDVSIELPAGSDVQGTSPLADFTCEGRLGDCRLKTSVGDIQVDEARAVYLKTDHGDIRLDRAAGDAEVAGAGRVDVGEIAGAATVKNLNGETTIGEVTGRLRANSSNGRISVGVAHASVDAKSANGGIRIGEVVRGQIVLQTAAGDLEVGIRESTAAWLDVNTRLGSVRNSLSPSQGPETSDGTVEVRARTGIGDIVIRRP